MPLNTCSDALTTTLAFKVAVAALRAIACLLADSIGFGQLNSCPLHESFTLNTTGQKGHRADLL